MPIIREATLDDIEILTNLRVTFLDEIGDISNDQQRQAFRDATAAYLRRAMPQGKILSWLAEADGQILATSALIPFEQAPTPFNLSGMGGYVLNIYTVPEWRGRGLARTLMETIIAYAQATGIAELWLYATDQGMPVYKRVGFVPISDAMGLRLLDK